MPSHDKPLVQGEPVVDEWGIYDPDRAGLAAVFEKLARVPSPEDAREMAASMRQAADLRTKK